MIPGRQPQPPLALGPAFWAATGTTVSLDAGSGACPSTLVSFAGCNYLGLAQHPAVLQAAVDAIPRFGLSTSASRTTSGHTALHAALESDIAQTVGTDRALLLPDGYIANLAALQALHAMGHTHALIDNRAHRSLYDAATMAGMSIESFATADVDDASRKLWLADREQTVILTDGVFTTDGRIAPLTDLVSLGATVLVDDCHGFGMLGPGGAGTHAMLGLTGHPNLIITSTLAKGIGCAGGFFAGPHNLIRAATKEASAFVCTTPASPPLVAAATVALNLARTDVDLHARLTANINAVNEMLNAVGLKSHDEPTPIFSFTLDESQDPTAFSCRLTESGIYIPLMSYPNGPAPQFFRFSVNANHTKHQLKTARDALMQAMRDTRGVSSVHG